MTLEYTHIFYCAGNTAEVLKYSLYLLLAASTLCLVSMVVVAGNDVLTGGHRIWNWAKERYTHGGHAGLVVRMKHNV